MIQLEKNQVQKFPMFIRGASWLQFQNNSLPPRVTRKRDLSNRTELLYPWPRPITYFLTRRLKCRKPLSERSGSEAKLISRPFRSHRCASRGRCVYRKRWCVNENPPTKWTNSLHFLCVSASSAVHTNFSFFVARNTVLPVFLCVVWRQINIH